VSVRLLVGALALQFLLAGIFIYFAVTGFPFLPTHAARSTDFDEQRAYADVRSQVARGPRPAGSAASLQLGDWLRARLPQGRFEAVPGGLRNVVGTLPGRGPAIVIGAHYDTKDLPGFVGADDGASGTAVVLELARALARPGVRPRNGRELRFVLFDGEESPAGTPRADFTRAGLRGSRAYLRSHRGEMGEMLAIDLVGQRNLQLRREVGSDAALWARLRAAADAAGVGDAFPSGTVPEVRDDHTPFARAGIPAIDLIDGDYPCFHRTCDTLAQIDPASLDAAGEAVVGLVRAEDARR
jgi:glutaminyl-peptide cyclotransferase